MMDSTKRAQSFAIFFNERAKTTPLGPKGYDKCRLLFLKETLGLRAVLESSKTITNQQFDYVAKKVFSDPKMIVNFISSYLDRGEF